jgi:hypothetical protein
MTKRDDYRQHLRRLEEWDSFLLNESGLPGARANLELAQAVADEGDEQLFRRYIAYGADSAPTNSPQEFLAFCGVLGLGRLLAEGRAEVMQSIRPFASDVRWRLREAVAMSLQRLGAADMPALMHEMQIWSGGSPLEKRAAAAALCEPGLLQSEQVANAVLQILDSITHSIQSMPGRRSQAFKALRKGLGYCWSVAVAAAPEAGKSFFKKWMASDDKDIRWIMKSNLRKKRLARMDPEWVSQCQLLLGMN